MQLSQPFAILSDPDGGLVFIAASIDWTAAAGPALSGILNAGHRGGSGIDQAELHKNRGLVSIDMFVRQLSIAQTHNGHYGTLQRPVGGEHARRPALACPMQAIHCRSYVRSLGLAPGDISVQTESRGSSCFAFLKFYMGKR
jgi:hypothetical protein